MEKSVAQLQRASSQHGGASHHSFLTAPSEADVDSPSVAPIHLCLCLGGHRSGQPTGQAAQGDHGAAVE
eukprot:3746180-Karenia_brevis.AAC.1